MSVSVKKVDDQPRVHYERLLGEYLTMQTCALAAGEGKMAVNDNVRLPDKRRRHRIAQSKLEVTSWRHRKH
jgi:hypothetical protein